MVHIFTKKEILTSLNILNNDYQKAYKVASSKNTLLLKIYSKIAVITAAGWIEDGMRSLAEISTIKLKDLNGQKRLKNRVDNIFGCSYKNHFSKALSLAFGAHGLEYIENKIGATDLAILESFMGNLKSWRDDAAHSYSLTIKTNPEMIILEINKILPILKQIESSARKYGDNHFK